MDGQIEICEDFCDFCAGPCEFCGDACERYYDSCCGGSKQKLISFDVGHSDRWVSVCEGCLEEALQKLKGVS